MAKGDNTISRTTETSIAVMSEQIKYIVEKVEAIERKVDAQYVTKVEFEPIKKIVYGLVGLILVTVVGAVLALVVIRPQ